MHSMGGLLTKDNFYNFFLTIIFDDVIYGIIYDILKILTSKQEKKL